MEIALGILGWAPETFWQATPREFWSAWAGWRRLNIPSSNKPSRFTDHEIEEIQEMLADEHDKVYKPGKGQSISAGQLVRIVGN